METSSIIQEIVEEYGLRSVSIKTNIPTDSLEKLATGDFNSFTKIQILGFAKIFEREYEVNLSEFKNDVRQHFSSYLTSSQGSILVPIQESSVGGFFSKLIPYLFFIATLYGAWYIYQNFYKKSNITPIAKIEQTQKIENQYFDIEKNKSSLDDKKNNIYSMQALDNPTKKKPLSKPDENTSNPKSEANTTINTTNTVEENTTKNFVVEEENRSQVTEENLSTSVELIIERSSIDLVPSKEMWFRVTNIKSRRYRTHRKQIEPFRFELSTTSWLMATKKGLFTFIDNNISKEYNANTPLYFKLDKSTGITPLSYQEYKSLGGYSVN